MEISVVILNWNGREFLGKCVPSVTAAVKAYGSNCEVIVVDNNSCDKSIDYLKSNFPQVNILPLKENLNFTKAMNIGIRYARYPLVICLNNDTIVDGEFIAPMVNTHSIDDNIFAVSAKMLLLDRKTLNFGRAIASFRFGFFLRRIIDSPMSINSLYACAGGFAVDRNKFLKLGGFDEDISIYWEDLDLCYRAWKQGWKTIYQPKSVIYHKFHGTNLKKYGQGGIDALSGENYFLFILKNIHDKAFFYRQLFLLPVLMLTSLLAGKSHFAKGLLSSLKRWPLFLKKRRMEKMKAVLSDREVFRISSQ